MLRAESAHQKLGSHGGQIVGNGDVHLADAYQTRRRSSERGAQHPVMQLHKDRSGGVGRNQSRGEYLQSASHGGTAGFGVDRAVSIENAAGDGYRRDTRQRYT